MFNLSNLKIGKKLFLGFGIAIVALIAIGVVGIVSINELQKTMKIVSTERIPAGSYLSSLNYNRVEIRSYALEVWIFENIDNSQNEFSRLKNLRDKNWEELNKIIDDYLKIPKYTEEGKRLNNELKDSFDKWKTASKPIDDIISKLSIASDQKVKQELFKKFDEAIKNATGSSERFNEVCNNLTVNNTEYTSSSIDADIDMAETLELVMYIVSLVSLLLSFFLAYKINQNISSPLIVGVDLAKAIAKGDLSKSVDNSLLNRSDEIGDLANAMQEMSLSLRNFFKDINQGVQTLAASSTELSAISDQMVSGAANMTDMVNIVASSSEETSINTTSVAASMEQATVNLNNVASATEEMSSTVGDIASNSEKARNISNEAMEQSIAVSSLMAELTNAAREIGKVTETISNISAQTNLLALNATIEAARAGAAGKGFAVVANEIKDLARQTAGATEDIKSRIDGIQNSTGNAVEEIQKITSIIKHVSEIVTGTAASIEEQAVVTRDVAGNIAQATTGVNDANRRLAETVTASKTIAKEINQVSRIVTEVATSGKQVQASSGDLSKLAEGLKANVSRFKV
ncbi:MAG: methyl-accepting chemotaxis protein [Candidatus Delongbacteria bacterium]|nr:methyl-accepting chemotaxis protein [Candidatus Delongbacteria bacterium]MBN2833542.1 methyl-accepting chemotaxis protein [Candidatus Delongbacteria bacterium]